MHLYFFLQLHYVGHSKTIIFSLIMNIKAKIKLIQQVTLKFTFWILEKYNYWKLNSGSLYRLIYLQLRFPNWKLCTRKWNFFCSTICEREYNSFWIFVCKVIIFWYCYANRTYLTSTVFTCVNYYVQRIEKFQSGYNLFLKEYKIYP